MATTLYKQRSYSINWSTVIVPIMKTHLLAPTHKKTFFFIEQSKAAQPLVTKKQQRANIMHKNK